MKNHGVQNGLIYGVLSIVITLVMYFIDPKMLFGAIYGIIGFIIPIYFMYKSSVNTRNDQNGLISFGEALTPAFITYLVGSLLGIIFMYILYNLIDPSLLQLQGEMAMETADKVFGLMGADIDDVQREEMNKAMLEQASSFGPASALMTWLGGLIPGVIIALIIAAIVKRNPQV